MEPPPEVRGFLLDGNPVSQLEVNKVLLCGRCSAAVRQGTMCPSCSGAGLGRSQPSAFSSSAAPTKQRRQTAANERELYARRLVRGGECTQPRIQLPTWSLSASKALDVDDARDRPSMASSLDGEGTAPVRERGQKSFADDPSASGHDGYSERGHEADRELRRRSVSTNETHAESESFADDQLAPAPAAGGVGDQSAAAPAAGGMSDLFEASYGLQMHQADQAKRAEATMYGDSLEMLAASFYDKCEADGCEHPRERARARAASPPLVPVARHPSRDDRFRARPVSRARTRDLTLSRSRVRAHSIPYLRAIPPRGPAARRRRLRALLHDERRAVARGHVPSHAATPANGKSGTFPRAETARPAAEAGSHRQLARHA